MALCFVECQNEENNEENVGRRNSLLYLEDWDPQKDAMEWYEPMKHFKD